MFFFGVSILAGILTVLAPCILPLLPVVVGSSEPGARRISRRALRVIGSLVVSVVLFTLLLKATTLFIEIPSYAWAWFSGTVLVLLGITMMFPELWAKVPIVQRIAQSGNKTLGSGYTRGDTFGDMLMGFALGPVFSTCSPTYLFIIATVLPASFFVGFVYLLGFALGLAFSLLLIAFFGQRIIDVVVTHMDATTNVKRYFGMLLVIIGIAIVTGLDKKFEAIILDSGYRATIDLEEKLIEQFTPLSDSSNEAVIEQPKEELQAKIQDTDPRTEVAITQPPYGSPQKAIMGTGCFWCVEHDFAQVEGVIDVVSGYAGGTNENPTYENYDDYGHREVVEVTYDPTKVSYGNLVEHTVKYGDPTDGAGSFYDRGEEYAPVIHYANEWEKQEAEAVIARIDALKVYEKPIAIDVVPKSTFWPAEEYHQDYSEKNTVKYNYYRLRSGRTAFIEKYWGENAGAFVVSDVPSKRGGETGEQRQYVADSWKDFIKPSDEVLHNILSSLQYEVTQKNGTEKPFTNAYDKNYEEGVYVDIVSGEPLYLSKDKYDSGTGWPSFVKPISAEAVTLHEDNTLFSKRTEVRSRYADSHLGHVFDDGPKDRGGKRYCMNSAALRFIPKNEMEKEGYAYLLNEV